jgi:superoxide dismutase, Fe-Mn family
MTADLSFNMGGNLNHQFFWDSLLPSANGGGQEPSSNSELGLLIDQTFGSITDFKNYFTTFAGKIKGSGWAWLVYNTMTN